MYLFRPQLLESLADYSRAKFMKDLVEIGRAHV